MWISISFISLFWERVAWSWSIGTSWAVESELDSMYKVEMRWLGELKLLDMKLKWSYSHEQEQEAHHYE